MATDRGGGGPHDDRNGGGESAGGGEADAERSDGPQDKSEDAGGDSSEDEPSGKDKAKSALQTPRGRAALITVAISLVIAGVWTVFWWLDARQYVSTKNAYLQAPVARISPGVSGSVHQVHVRRNQMVQAGQLLMVVSPASFEAALAEAEAELASAQGQLRQARAAHRAALSQIGESAATARAREAEADEAAREFRRYASLSAAAVAEQERDQARGQARTTGETAAAARQGVVSARARAEQALADITAAEARVRQAEASLRSARLSVADTTIEAPIAGRVTQLELEPGDYVSPGQPALAIVGPARWVEANFKEDQLRLMRPGQPVEIEIDAFAGFPLRAQVDSFQTGTGSEFSALPAQNATGNWVETVQRVPVRLRFEPDAFRDFPRTAPVLPGMSVQARVKVR